MMGKAVAPGAGQRAPHLHRRLGPRPVPWVRRLQGRRCERPDGAYVSSMPRPAWTGSISFGLVNIPIKLFSATESRRIGFRELEEGTGRRIRYKRVAEGSGREVEWKKIQKGFEVAKDRYVVLTNEELEAAEP